MPLRRPLIICRFHYILLPPPPAFFDAAYARFSRQRRLFTFFDYADDFRRPPFRADAAMLMLIFSLMPFFFSDACR